MGGKPCKLENTVLLGDPQKQALLGSHVLLQRMENRTCKREVWRLKAQRAVVGISPSRSLSKARRPTLHHIRTFQCHNESRELRI